MKIFKIQVNIKGKASTIGVMAKDKAEAEAIVKGMTFYDKDPTPDILKFFKGFKK